MRHPPEGSCVSMYKCVCSSQAAFHIQPSDSWVNNNDFKLLCLFFLTVSIYFWSQQKINAAQHAGESL